jgi:polysaccharide biosynthesis transport protein
MNSRDRALPYPPPYGRQVALIPDEPALTREFTYPEEPEGLIDLRLIWSAAYRNRYLVLIVLAVALALGVLSLLIMDPTYRAAASVEIDQQPVKVLGTEDSEPFGSTQEADRMLQTQVDVLHSRALAERVSNSLNLAANDNFLRAMGVKPIPGARQNLVISALMANLGATLPRATRVVPITFDSKNPIVAADVANSYAENLISGNLQRRFDTSSYSKKFLEGQLALTKARLENSERALLTYARSVGLVDPSAGINPGNQADGAGDTKSLTTANLVQLNNALAASRAARMEAQGRWDQARATPLMSLPDVLGNAAIQQLTQKRAEAQAEYQQELQHRKPDHPQVQQAAAQLKELDQQIATLAASIRESIHNQYEVASKQEAAISASVAQLKGATLAEQGLGIQYNILKREVDTNRQMYDGLLQRYKEVNAEAGVTSNNISLVDRAIPPPAPISPNPVVNMGLAAIAGLVVAFLLIALREMFYNGVRAPDEVEQRFGLALLGTIPRLASRGGAERALLDPRSQVSEAYQSVLASMQLSSESGTPKTLLVTSSREQEGKSTTALALARDLARSGKAVLLIDADLRRPSLHSTLGLPKEPGLTNLLTQESQTFSGIQESDTDGLHVMTAGPQPPNPAELLSGTRFANLVSSLAEHYDNVIIDGPPVLGLADAPHISAVVDGTLVVIEANRSHRGAVKAALQRLATARARIVGAVLAKFDPSKADFGSAYMLSYYSYGEGGPAAGATADA